MNRAARRPTPARVILTLLSLALLWLSPSSPQGATEGRGSVAGRVSDSSDGSPIAGAIVVAVDPQGRQVAVLTDASGDYRIDGLHPGTYSLEVQAAEGFVTEVYDDVPCPACGYLDATPVDIVAGATTPGVDFALDPPSLLHGTVTDETTGGPISGITVQADLLLEERVLPLATGVSGEDGGYTVEGLSRGIYGITTLGRFGYLPELYDDQPCTTSESFPSCGARGGTAVDVAARSNVSGIDFALVQGGRILGTVRDSVTGAPVGSVRLTARHSQGTWAQSGMTDALGRYVIDGLAEGSYTVESASSYGFLEELFDDVPCGAELAGSCEPSQGTPLMVSLGADVTGIDFDLSLVRGIRGRITSESTGLPLAGIAVRTSGPFEKLARSDDEGRFVVGLPAGRYFVSTFNDLGFVDEIYDGISCPDGVSSGSCSDLRQGSPIVLRDSTVQDGVDFALAEASCASSDEALCLNEGRFQVRVTWRDRNGNAGSGQAVRLPSESGFYSADSGYFWFFNDRNVELVVKLLDGCSQPVPAFWFFAAGLTTVATEITVTDTVTGGVKTYSKPLGDAFEPILDTRAFATCSTANQRSASLTPPDLLRRTDATFDRLRLGSGRFFVEAQWRTASGQTGSAQSLTLTSDSGYFWFFAPDNAEVVVKVLDACDLDPYNSFWVFAAGLTTVEVKLRVTDTASGQVTEYFNPLDSPFQPVLDTHAFDACDF